MLIVGTSAVETDIFGMSGTLIVGTDGAVSGRFMVGTEMAGTSFTWIEGASGS
jgi:hypothetical protein